MKIKEIRYISADGLQTLQTIVNAMLEDNWTIIGTVSFGHGCFIQEMGLQPVPKETHMIITDHDLFDFAVNKKMREGYTLFGQPFALDGQICQALLRFE